ncbi:MAG: GIY-YIG nuclease family protein [Candidatus Sungbacteria bacterium]|uniref:GIY-YIG nuclease family protein n=1 Tax=Candidatus Sungiibacteriota bacterium TaxID=2750080 RepID=A0A931SC84_9BACT|nr:GIY-YIG nuclease family protein [Candidatus Sungbacteria bacterium]
MPFVYIPKSLKNGKRYVGSTALVPGVRLKEHNHGANQFTRENRQFILIHQEKYASIKEARQRENFLKSGVGRKFLDVLLNEE